MELKADQTGSRLKDQNNDIVAIAKGGGIATLGSICRVFLNFVIRLVLTRTMSLESVGLYFLGMTVMEFSKTFATIGLDNGLLKFASIAHGKNDIRQMKGYVMTAFKIAIPGAILFSITLFFLSGIISVRLLHNPDMSKVIRILAVTIPVTITTTICIFSIQACKQIKYRVYVQDLADPLIRIVALVAFVFMGYQLMGALTAYIISVVLSSFLGLYFLNKKLPFTTEGQITRSQVSEFLRFSITQTSTKVINILMNTLNIFMISFFLVISDVGVYNVASRLVVIGTIFLFSFNQILNPMISDLANSSDYKRIEKNYQTVTKLITVFSLPVYLVMIMFPRESLMIFGEGYTAGVNCLIILAVGQIVNSLTGSVGVILNMSGKHVLSLYTSIGTLALNIILNLFLIPRYGISGAAIATLISVVLANLIRLVQVYFIFGIHPYNLSYLKPLFVGTAMIMFFIGLKQLFSIELNIPSFLFVVISYFGIYFLIIKLIGLTEEENIILVKLKAKIFKA